MTKPLRPRNDLVVADLPFGLRTRQDLEYEYGLTLAEIVDSIEDLPPMFATHGLVLIGENEIDPQFWHRVKPKPGNQVSVALRLGRGGGSQATKTAISILGTIAILAATVATGGGALAFLGPYFAAGAWGARFAAAAVGLLGSTALQALTKPKAAGAAGADPTQPDAASIAGNILAKNARLARVIGGPRRIAPGIVQPPFGEIVGDDEYVSAIFMLAGPHAMANPRLGDTLIEALQDVQLEVKNGVPGESQQTLVPWQAAERQPGIVMISHDIDKSNKNDLANQADPDSSLPQWHRVTTRDSPDEVWITIVAPEGIYNDEDGSRQMSLPFRIRFRLVGTDAWINGPEFWMNSIRPVMYRKMIKLKFGQTLAALGVSAYINDSNSPTYCYWSVADSFTGLPVSQNSGWTADLSFKNSATINDVKNVARYKDRIEFYMDPSVFPQGQYEIELMHASPLAVANWNENTYIYSFFGTVAPTFGWYINSSPARIPYGGDRTHQTVVIAKICDFWYENPVPLYGEDATISVRVKNRAADQLTVEASGMVPMYDSTTGEWVGLAATNHPEPHFRDILTGSLNELPLPADLSDDAALVAWGAFCDTAYSELRLSAICEQGSVMEALTLAAVAGKAGIRSSDVWGPVWERDRSGDSPVQVFTPRNAAEFMMENNFDRRADGQIVTFQNAALQWTDDDVVVYDDGQNADTAKIMEALRQDASDDAAQVAELSLMDQRIKRLRAMMYHFSADPEALRCTRGDLIGYQHDILQRQAGFARVVSINKSGGLILGLTLDASIPIVTTADFWSVADYWAIVNYWNQGITTGVGIRLTDNSILVKEVSDATGDQTVINFVTPFADPGATLLEGYDDLAGTAGCLVWCGPLDSEYLRFIVASIKMGPDMRVMISAVDEAPAINA